MDISSFFNSFLNLMVTGVTYCFNTLDRISFNGVTLLQFCLWVMILSALIPIVFTVVRTQSSKLNSRRSSASSRKQESSSSEE